MTVPINHAFYVKLGVGGCWEDDSLANACIRVGFPHQNVADINAGNWAKIKKQLDAGKKQSVATADLNPAAGTARFRAWRCMGHVP
jgi:hypothetical protein